MLLDQPGEVVLRSEIRQRIWPGETVMEFDQSINQAVKRLRTALSDSADAPRYIGAETAGHKEDLLIAISSPCGNFRFLRHFQPGSRELLGLQVAGDY